MNQKSAKLAASCLAACLMVLSISGCGLAPAATATPTLAPTLTPLPTATPKPTNTPKPTATPTDTPVPGTPTPEPDSISGILLGPDGPILGAEVTLQTFADEACVTLAHSTTTLSDADQAILDECSGDYATVESDADGYYVFAAVSPGWYKLNFQWDLSEKPDLMFPIESRDGFIIAYYETTDVTPQQYFALAIDDEIFEFSGEAAKLINFDYDNP